MGSTAALGDEQEIKWIDTASSSNVMRITFKVGEALNLLNYLMLSCINSWHGLIPVSIATTHHYRNRTEGFNIRKDDFESGS